MIAYVFIWMCEFPCCWCLVLTSLGDSVTFEAYPQRISMSIYLIDTAMRAILRLLRRNKWFDIASLTDSSSVFARPFHRGLLEGFNNLFVRNNTPSGVHYNVFQCDTSRDAGQTVSIRCAVSATTRSEKINEKFQKKNIVCNCSVVNRRWGCYQNTNWLVECNFSTLLPSNQSR